MKVLNVPLLLLAFTLPGMAHAEYVNTDWKVTGDSRAVLDVDTGIEWLRLINTRDESMDSALSKLDSDFAGWRLPTNEEVESMGTRFFAQYGVENMQFNYTTTRTGNLRVANNGFIEVFGDGYKTAAWHYGAYYDEDDTLKTFGSYANEGGDYTATRGLEHTTEVTARFPQGAYNTGIFLVSDGGTTLSSKLDPSMNANNANAPVNNVAVTLMGALSLFGLALVRRRKG